MEIPSLLRIAEHQALKGLRLNGSVLDIGGDARSSYRALIDGVHTFTTVNIDPKAHPDIVHNLEKPFSIQDDAYDHALLINVLEHVFEYRQLLEEAVRVVKPGGSIVIIVPFLFPIHPSPHDFHRFTAEILERECARAGLNDIHIVPLGTGVFTARYVMFDRLLPAPLRLISHYTVRFCVVVADILWNALAQLLGKQYNPAHYALGYCVHAARAHY